LRPSVGATLPGRLVTSANFAADLLRAEQLERWDDLRPMFVRAA
jgi:hypothetical protein